MEAALVEQQRSYLKQGSLDTKKIGFYILALPADELGSICVIHIMRYLLNEFLSNTNKEAERLSGANDAEFNLNSIDVKIPAIKLFSDLGQLVDKQLK